MSRVAFHLKRSNVDTPQRVFALFHIEGKQVKLYTTLSVKPQDWSKHNQRMKPSCTGSAVVNDQLSEIQRTIEKIAYQLQRSGDLTPERLKYEFQVSTNTTPEAKRTVLSHIDDWIEDAEDRHQELTIRNYHTFKGHLKKFCESRKFTPTISAVDKKFVDEFAGYLTKTVKLMNTSRWNQLKTLKTFLHWAGIRAKPHVTPSL